MKKIIGLLLLVGLLSGCQSFKELIAGPEPRLTTEVVINRDNRDYIIVQLPKGASMATTKISEQTVDKDTRVVIVSQLEDISKLIEKK